MERFRLETPDRRWNFSIILALVRLLGPWAEEIVRIHPRRIDAHFASTKTGAPSRRIGRREGTRAYRFARASCTHSGPGGLSKTLAAATGVGRDS